MDGNGLFLTGRWAKQDSNRWSRHRETPFKLAIGSRARLGQLGEPLIPRGTTSSNPASSSGEMVWGRRRGRWHHRRC